MRAGNPSTGASGRVLLVSATVVVALVAAPLPTAAVTGRGPVPLARFDGEVRVFENDDLGLTEPVGLVASGGRASIGVVDRRPSGRLDLVTLETSGRPIGTVEGFSLAGGRHLTDAGSSLALSDPDAATIQDAIGREYEPLAAVVAASADPTDSPSVDSLFVLAAGDTGTRLLEVSAIEPAAAVVGVAVVGVTLLSTVLTSGFSPPSPDPSGIGYDPDTGNVVISDGEVNEMAIFAGANVFESTRGGTLVRTGNSEPESNEPTGVAVDAPGNRLFISDDTGDRGVYEVRLGADGIFDTADDSWSFLSMAGYGSDDPEGVAFDTATSTLIVSDGVGEEIYVVRPGPNGVFEGAAPGSDDVMTHWDATAIGIDDPEGVEFNPVNGRIYLLGHTGLVAETLLDGTLVRYLDLSTVVTVDNPAGLAFGPPSASSGGQSLYVVDRGVDNNNDPNENDGVMWEFSFDPNSPPVVDVGPDQVIQLEDTLALSASVFDDGLPNPPGTVTHMWSAVSGPGAVAFGSQTSSATTATFSDSGLYRLRLSADDGAQVGSDELVVSVADENGLVTIERRIAGSTDDAEESPAGAVDLNSSDVELVYDVGDQVVGLRFESLAVPQGAQILQAHVQFTVDESNSGATSLTIRAQSSDSAPPFTSVAGNISSRPTTAGAVAWSPTPWTSIGAAGPDQRTPDLSAIVQEVVDRPGWAAGNALAVVVRGTGERTAEAVDGVAAAAPLLTVVYSLGPVNAAPSVSAGPDAVVVDPGPVSLDGTVSDDGLPDPPGVVTTAWSVVSGPATVSFGDPSAVDTTATFAAAGAYVLRLTADDGARSASSDLMVTVTPPNRAPSVSAGPDVSTPAGVAVSLDGTVSDDGLPDPPGVVATAWSVVSGPETVVFGDPSLVDTSASFSSPGTYVLRLRADDSELSSVDEVSVTVTPPPPNTAPSVSAGPDVSTPAGVAVSLDGTVSDDGLPDPPGVVTTAWSVVSGPGTVVFGDPSLVDTSASFSSPGTYVLRLTADDSELSSVDEVSVSVTPPPPNTAPSVSAGPDVSTSAGVAVSLDGTVSDDGLPDPPGVVTTAWSVVSGPGTVVFGDPSLVDTSASFSSPGTYVLRLTADDSELSSVDEVSVTVTPTNAVPFVSAGFDAVVTVPGPVSLDGSVSDDGLPDPPGAVATAWSVVSGPGAVAFTDSTSVDTSASFSTPGTYVLRLTADDSAAASSDDVTITVTPANVAPSVSAGPDRVIGEGGQAVLDGTVSDDGMPSPPGVVTTAWSLVSGPGTVSFSDASAVDTTATFSAPGDYVLRLTANDSELTSVDEMSVAVSSQSETVVLDRRIAASDDDAEERSNGSMDVTSSDLELVHDRGGEQTVGLRFTSLGIPNGAIIIDAWIQFTTDETPADATQLQIQAQEGGGAAPFSSSSFDISSRPVTTTSVPWVPAIWSLVGEAGPAQRTPSLASVVQEAVNRPGWTTASPLVVIITGQGERVASSFDGKQAQAPVLHVEYATPDQDRPTVDAGSDLTVEVNLAVALDGAVSDDGLPDPPGAVTTTWSKVSGPGSVTFADPAATDTNATFSTPGTYVLRLTADDGQLTAGDELIATVTGPGGQVSFQTAVVGGTDDAEEAVATGAVDDGSSDLELVDDRGLQIVGVRFNGVTIPRGAVIVDAWIQFTVDERSLGLADLMISAQASDDAPAFQEVPGNLSSRARSAASVSWTPAEWQTLGAAGPDQRTPTLAAVVAEVVSRPGWQEGNSIVLLITGSGKRVAESYNGNPGAAAVLHVDFVLEVPGAG